MIDRIRARTLALPRRGKQTVLVIFDFISISFAMWASFSLRYDSWYAPSTLDYWAIIVSPSIIAIPIFIRMGLYRAVVRYLPERAMLTILQAVLATTIAWVLLIFLSQMAVRFVVPRSVPIIFFGISTFMIAGSRFAAKWTFLPKRDRVKADQRAVVIYGAGEAGMQLAQSLRSTHRIVGYLDDNPNLHRRELAGVRVYPPGELKVLMNEYDVKDVILSIPSLSAQRRKEIVSAVSTSGLKLLALPSIVDLVTGKYLVSQIKEIDVVELLGRSSVPPDPELIRKMIVGRSIMVTGAGGSIGSELCRKIARWKPQRLVLFEANEFALYQIERELADIAELTVIPVLGSVTERARVDQALAQNDVKVVFHAAAHKHVPLVEANAIEGIRNNVLGTKTVAEGAFDAGVASFVLISSDKAVRPTNVMGATKRWAEFIVQLQAQKAAESATGQRFSAVRFGNVLGSNGSVVPLFKEQIAHGGPITLTDAAMTRYFMSIHEAAELIVQAGSLSAGSDVFLLDMGEPVLIKDLAENMIRLAGLTVRSDVAPDGDIELIEVGKRPGEKMYEELFYDDSMAGPTRHPKIMRASGDIQGKDVPGALAQLTLALDRENEVEARRILFEFIQ